MLTYVKWKKQLIQRRMKEYGCSYKDAAYGIRSSQWWNQEILPALEHGKVLTKSVIRSIHKNGGGFSLLQICKHWNGQWPQDVSCVDGKTKKMTPT